MARKQLFQFRRDTAANWTSVNPTLAAGEPGYESDTGKIKFGDGATAWVSLAYNFVTTATPDATPSAKGVIQLAGDLTGTASLPVLASIIASGTTGSASSSSVVTRDAKGRITSASDVVIQITESQVTNLTSDLSTLTSNVTSNANKIAGISFNVVNKTANYTAVGQDFVVADASGGAFTITLPTAPVDKTMVRVKKKDSSVNGVLITVGTGDTFSNGTTSANLPVQGYGVTLQYISASTSWTAISNDFPITQADARYPLNTATPNGDLAGSGSTYASPALVAVGTAGTYGSGSAIPVITTDSKGRVSSVTTVAPATQTATGTAGGDLTGSYPNPALIATGTAGTYGSASAIPIITTDAKGRVTSVTTAAPATQTATGTAGGDLTGTYPNPNLVTAGTAGTYAYPISVTTDTKGRVTSVTAGSVTGTGSIVLATAPTLTNATISGTGAITTSGTTRFSGGFSLYTNTFSANTTLTTSQAPFVVASSSTAFTITLPSTTSVGYFYVIKNVGTAQVTIAGTIDAATNVVLNQYDEITVLSTTTAGTWYTIDAYSTITPISRGGTGSSTQNFVDLTTAQTAIGGTKQFTNSIAVGAAINTGKQLRLYGTADQGLLIESSGDHPRLELKGSSGTSVLYGSNNGSTLDLLPTTSAGVNSGNFTRVNAADYVMDTTDASSTTTVKQAMGIRTGAKWWNGTASIYVGMQMYPIIDASGNARFAFTVGTEMFTMYNTVAGVNTVGIGTGSTFATSTLQVKGSMARTTTTVTTATTLSIVHDVLRLNSTSALTHTLPDASTCTGRVYTLKNVNTGAQTVATTASQTIDGATTYALNTQYKYVVLQSNGANWDIIGNN